MRQSDFPERVLTLRQYVRLAPLLLSLVFLISCVPVRSSPFSEETESSVSNLNQSQLTQITSQQELTEWEFVQNGEIVINAVADSHQNYSDLEDWVSVANRQRADFLVHLGDFTNQGLNFEYDGYLKLMSRLNKPYLTVLGNHDTVTKGRLLYKRLIGDYNKSFEYKGYKFILFNNNRLDFISEGLDWDWLEVQIRSSSLPVVLMMHVDPDNRFYFQQQDKDRFWDMIADSQVRLILNGHQHVFVTEKKSGVIRHQVHRVEGVRWSRVILKKDTVTIEQCQKEKCTYEAHQNFASE